MQQSAESHAAAHRVVRQLDLYRSATPTQKLAVVARLNGVLLGLREAELERQFPRQSPTERRRMLRRWWVTARD